MRLHLMSDLCPLMRSWIFLLVSPTLLDAAESAFYQVNDIDGGTGDIFPDLEGLLGCVACEGVGLSHVFTVFASRRLTRM